MGFLIEGIGAFFTGALLRIAGSLVYRVLAALGMGVLSFTGMESSFTFVKNGAISAFGGLPPQVLSVLAELQVGSCISMIFSAMVMRATFEALFGGARDTIKFFIKT